MVSALTLESGPLLSTAGAGLLLLFLAAAETSFVTGLVVPAGVALALAAFLAAEGYLPLSLVVGSAATGALLGDLAGFWLGRRYGRRLFELEGRLGRLARRYEPKASALFQRHGAFSVSVARTVSFVRTLMPWMAGMTDMRFGRFLAYDLVGIAGWAVLYVGAGTLAGRNWRRVVGAVGTGGLALFAALALLLWLVGRRRARREGGP